MRIRLGLWAIGRPALTAAAIATLVVGAPLGIATLAGADESVTILVTLGALLAHAASLVVMRRYVRLDELVGALRRRRGAGTPQQASR